MHPQSIVHSMVEFTDGAMIAQLSLPDMRLPIGYALAYPDRIGTPFGRLDWATTGRLDFEAPDIETFACLRLAYDAGRIGGTAPAWLNAANEVAVAAFLAGQIPWIAIPDVLSEVLSRHDGNSADSVDAVIAADRTARAVAAQVIRQRHACDRGADCSDDRHPGAGRRDIGSDRTWVAHRLVPADRRHRRTRRAGVGVRGHRRDRAARDDLHARARPLPHREVGGDEGHRVLPRLRSPHLVVPQGRDRVRPEGDPPGRLRPHHRDAQPRPGRSRGRASRVQEPALLAEDERRFGRLDDALHHGGRPAVLPVRLLRSAAEQRVDRRVASRASATRRRAPRSQPG